MTAVYALPSPLGTLTLAADGDALTGLWMEGQKYFRAQLMQRNWTCRCFPGRKHT